ncbi:MAG TPA: aminotransferase class IV, partial [Sphingomicrobium sp.]|nr:aminotransferase class IV [Sphingomicrobium sp.]
PSGAVAIEVAPMPVTPADPVEVEIAPLPVAPTDFRLRHKTSDRAFYDRARNGFETLFEVDGQLTEGSFTNLFVERDGVLLTPPLGLGLLPGVLRAELIESGRAVEAALARDDLARGFFLGNALRGLIPARLKQE